MRDQVRVKLAGLDAPSRRQDGRVEDATRQPEQIRAFRREARHPFVFAYLRDRLTVARELLTETGSIFVQIGDETCKFAAFLTKCSAVTTTLSITVKKKAPTQQPHRPGQRLHPVVSKRRATCRVTGPKFRPLWSGANSIRNGWRVQKRRTSDGTRHSLWVPNQGEIIDFVSGPNNCSKIFRALGCFGLG